MISEELEIRIYQCLDGSCSEEEKRSLFSELDGNAEAIELYCRCATLDAGLQRIAQGQLELEKSEGRISEMMQKRKRIFSPAVAMCLVGFLGLMILAFSLFKGEKPAGDPSQVVSIKSTTDTQYSVINEDGSRRDNTSIKKLAIGSRLIITQGSVELEYKSGVRSIITAPADVVLDGTNQFQLDRGAAWFHIPKEAVGFKVYSKELEVIDLGTEFGVLSTHDGEGEVHVFNGKVLANILGDDKRAETLLAGEARSVDNVGKLTSISTNKEQFITELPQGLVAYEGPLTIAEGAQIVTKGGVGYTLSANKEMTTLGLKNGECIINQGGQLSIVFAKAVDLEITSADISYSNERPWNTDVDFGSFSITGGNVSKFSDPNDELEIESVSMRTFKWKFRKHKASKYRTPSLQTWKIELEGVRELSFSKSAISEGRAAFKFSVNTP